MTTSRKLLISGEALDADPKGYRSRRLSINENDCPRNSVYAAEPVVTSSVSAPVKQDKPYRWLFRTIVNATIASLLWYCAVNPQYGAIVQNLSTKVSSYFSDRLSADHSMEIPLPELTPYEEPMQRIPAIEMSVMSEIGQVKNQLYELERAVSFMSLIPPEPARDAELERMQSVIADLTKRFETLVEETSVQKPVSEQPAVPVEKPEVVPPRVNVANGKLGALIWPERTSQPRASSGVLVKGVVSLISWMKSSPRYQLAKEKLEKRNGPEIVLDEQPVRGYGDGYCLEMDGLDGEEQWLQVGIILPYSNKITGIQLEYVREEFDYLPESRPKFATIESLDRNDKSLDYATFKPEFDDDGIYRAPLNFTAPTDR